eukprot:CAMPEP_0182428212 /NCGR_PEP_ID=MMETSP1167-20130531/21497_1 /TAXON_ID=2988 /ORGANISM="Mallomonas Sp, Strain CCMP3275" /LENGTH=268 /DNA_ID=CAMNT_0024610959 /DNA_START=149 /DNA_END=955 /DNA_ORIENTATION=+
MASFVGNCPLPADSSILIVGSNRGLGLELAKSTVAAGLTVYGTTRTTNPDMEALSSNGKFTVVPGIDMLDEQAGTKIAAGLPAGRIDYVLLVAGYFTTETFDELNFDEQRKMMEICAFAPLRVTQQLHKSGHIVSGTKIGMITSEGGSIGLRTEKEGGANYGHHMSKCAQNMMGKIMALDLKPRGVAIVQLHPGFLRTEMTSHYSQFYEEFGAITADKAVEPILTAVHQLKLDDVPGKFIAPMGSAGLGLGVNALPNSYLEPFGELPW